MTRTFYALENVLLYRGFVVSHRFNKPRKLIFGSGMDRCTDFVIRRLECIQTLNTIVLFDITKLPHVSAESKDR